MDPDHSGSPPPCCPRIMPASVVTKLNKINMRSGLYKLVGEFGLKENLYYGSIFLCMTLIVVVCFLVINNRGGEHLAGTASAIFDSGKNAAYFQNGGQVIKSSVLFIFSEKQCELLVDPVHGEVHQTGRYLGDRAIYTCSAGWEIVGPEERVCQASGRWSNTEPYCKKRGS